VHWGSPALKAISIPFSCFIVTSSKGNDKMMLFHRNAPCFFLRRNLQRKFINRSDEVKLFLGRVDQLFNFPHRHLPPPETVTELLRASVKQLERFRHPKVLRKISIGNVNEFLSIILPADPSDPSHRRRMSRHVSFRN
jgi:hypothetical protein